MPIASIVVLGRPVSHGAHADSRKKWMKKVYLAAKDKFLEPLTDDDLRIRMTFFYRQYPSFDTDNISKPICDALIGAAYLDDSQLAQRDVGRRRISGSYRLEGAEPDLIAALADGQEFVYIVITKVEPDEL